MNKITIKTNSLFYHFISNYCKTTPTNSCILPWVCLTGFIGILIVITALTIMFGFPVLSLLALLFVGWHETIYSDAFHAIIFLIGISMTIVWLMFGIIRLWDLLYTYVNRNKRMKRYDERQPSNFSIWWKSFKEKYCVPVEIEEVE